MDNNQMNYGNGINNQTPNNENNAYKWETRNSNYNGYVSAKEVNKRKGKKPIFPLVIALVVGIAVGGSCTAAGFMIGKNFYGTLSNQTVTTTTGSALVTGTNTTGSAQDINDVSSLVEQVMPSVVALTSMSRNTSNYSMFGYNYNSEQSNSEVATGAGSGVIISQNDTELLILTSYHVVEDSSSVVVKFCNDVEVTGSLKSAQSAEDLAIVQVKLADIDSDTLSKIKVAAISSEGAKVGEGVVAIGNALGYGQSVTTGIVSALNKTLTVSTGQTLTLLQTDAAINSGNSGGALVNAKGELIGINEARYTSGENVCFAIPISDKTEIIQSLINATTRETVAESERGYVGIYGQDVSSSMAQQVGVSTGVYIQSVISGSAAEKAGLQKSDIIVALDGNRISSMSELQSVLTYYKAGETVKIKYYTVEGNAYVEKTTDITLGQAVQ